MTRLAVLIENGIADFQISHSRKSVRRRNFGVQGQLLALLLRYFHIGRIELPIAVLFEHSKDIPDNPLLPVDELKGLARPGSLGVAQALDEAYGVICSSFVVT